MDTPTFIARAETSVKGSPLVPSGSHNLELWFPSVCRWTGLLQDVLFNVSGGNLLLILFCFNTLKPQGSGGPRLESDQRWSVSGWQAEIKPFSLKAAEWERRAVCLLSGAAAYLTQQSLWGKQAEATDIPPGSNKTGFNALLASSEKPLIKSL